MPVPEPVARGVARNAIVFARFLLEHGFPPPGILDWATRSCLEEAGAFAAVPNTLLELAERDTDPRMTPTTASPRSP
jgi:hypothetical protein